MFFYKVVIKINVKSKCKFKCLDNLSKNSAILNLIQIILTVLDLNSNSNGSTIFKKNPLLLNFNNKSVHLFLNGFMRTAKDDQVACIISCTWTHLVEEKLYFVMKTRAHMARPKLFSFMKQYNLFRGARRPGDRGSIPGRGKGFFLYPLCSDRLWGLPSLLSNEYRGSFPRG
jgi:hypothetical protein